MAPVKKEGLGRSPRWHEKPRTVAPPRGLTGAWVGGGRRVQGRVDYDLRRAVRGGGSVRKERKFGAAIPTLSFRPRPATMAEDPTADGVASGNVDGSRNHLHGSKHLFTW